jgi:hypothetical protein
MSVKVSIFRVKVMQEGDLICLQWRMMAKGRGKKGEER